MIRSLLTAPFRSSQLAEEVYGWLWADGVHSMPKEDSAWNDMIEPWVKLDKDRVATHKYRLSMASEKVRVCERARANTSVRNVAEN